MVTKRPLGFGAAGYFAARAPPHRHRPRRYSYCPPAARVTENGAKKRGKKAAPATASRRPNPAARRHPQIPRRRPPKSSHPWRCLQPAIHDAGSRMCFLPELEEPVSPSGGPKGWYSRQATRQFHHEPDPAPSREAGRVADRPLRLPRPALASGRGRASRPDPGAARSTQPRTGLHPRPPARPPRRERQGAISGISPSRQHPLPNCNSLCCVLLSLSSISRFHLNFTFEFRHCVNN